MSLTEEEKEKIRETEKIKKEEETKAAIAYSKAWLKIFFIGMAIFILAIMLLTGLH